MKRPLYLSTDLWLANAHNLRVNRRAASHRRQRRLFPILLLILLAVLAWVRHFFAL